MTGMTGMRENMLEYPSGVEGVLMRSKKIEQFWAYDRWTQSL